MVGSLAAGSHRPGRAAVTGALYAAGRLHTPNYTFSLFGKTGLAAITLKSLLASVVLGLAAVQVLLALWLYRKLPLAGNPPRPVRPAHRVLGFSPRRRSKKLPIPYLAGSRMGAARHWQTRPDAMIPPASLPLSCENNHTHHVRRLACSVRDEEAASSARSL